MANYRPNTDDYRESKESEEARAIAPVVKGNVKVKKESVGKKFADVFLADNLDNVKSYIIFDVIVPEITDTIVNALTGGISMLFKGTPTNRRGSSHSNNRTNYSVISRSPSQAERRTNVRDRHGVMDIIFDTRGDALEVKDCLLEIIDKYKMVSIADYYDLAKVGDQSNYTDRNYGWFELDDIQVTRDRDGYRLRLPRPEALN